MIGPNFAAPSHSLCLGIVIEILYCQVRPMNHVFSHERSVILHPNTVLMESSLLAI